MINGNIVNGNAINGSGFENEFDAYVLDYLSVNETLSFIIHKNVLENIGIRESLHEYKEHLSITEHVLIRAQYNYQKNDNVFLNENLNFKFTKGISSSDNISIAENVSIVVGNLINRLDDAPITIGENLTVNLAKGVLMEPYILYYLNLLIIQYRNLPKATQHIRTLVGQALIDLMPSILESSFDLETAEGAQLDILGEYIGISRRVKTFDADVTLNDDDYRIILKIKRSTNNMGSSFYDIQNFIETNLSGVIRAFDHKDMNISFYMNSILISSTLAQAIITQIFLPKPMGVGISSIVLIPSFDNIFAMADYSMGVTDEVGFNSYTSYDSTKRFLKYEDAA